MRIIDFSRPTDLREACNMLAELGPRGCPLAGATSLVFMAGDDEKIAVDINHIGLNTIIRQNGLFQVGSLARVSDLQHFAAEGWVLNRVAVELASQQIRNISTLGGNIVRVFPWADFPVALLTLDAVMRLGNANEARAIPAQEYFNGQPFRLLKPGELLQGVDVPALSPGEGFGYKKARWVATGFSIVTVAAYVKLEGDRIAAIRAAIGGGVPFPARVADVESMLQGQRATERVLRDAARTGLNGIKFKDAEGLSADYVGQLAAVSLGDVLVEAWFQAKEQKA